MGEETADRRGVKEDTGEDIEDRAGDLRGDRVRYMREDNRGDRIGDMRGDSL
jgi:hypothetical protein